ncbi:MAG: DinB family protein [Actinomycetota bacterium]
MADVVRQDPPLDVPELEMLRAFLDYHRATILQKIADVDEEDLRKQMVPSGTSLLGILKHLAHVERWWFRTVFHDEELDYPWTDDDPDADWRIDDSESAEDIVRLYKYETAMAREIVNAAAPDDVAKRKQTQFSLRWILLHMIQETARHNGHADILREMVDGAIGE